MKNKFLFLGILLGIVVGIFTILFGLEFYFQIKTFSLPPNDHPRVTWGHKVVNNRFGFREKEFALAHPSDTFRIMVLGDSFTWGMGLGVSERYSNLLQQYLRQAYPTKKIEVLNFAMPGGATENQRDVLQRFYQVIHPDLVIVGFCLNDTQNQRMDFSPEREYFIRKIGPWLGFLQRCQLPGSAYMVQRIYQNILVMTGQVPSWPDALDRTYRKNSGAWQSFAAALKEIAQMSREVSQREPIFISLNQGISNVRPTDYNHPDLLLKRFLGWYHQAESVAKEHGFIAVNCESEFKNELKTHVMAVVKGGDMHPDAAMNKIYARKLFEVIRAQRWLD